VLFIALSMWAACPPARADEVSGTVKIGKEPARNATLVFRRERPSDAAIEVVVVADQNGRFRVFLEPGRYRASLSDGPAEVQVQSLPAPVQRDLEFPPK
jgi:hypothetical protein